MIQSYDQPPDFNYGVFHYPNNAVVHLYLGPHVVANDLPPADDLHDILRSSDIVVKEIMGTDDQFLALTNRVAGGGVKALRQLMTTEGNNTNSVRFYEALFDSRPKVLSVDVPRFDPALEHEFAYRRAAGQIATDRNFDRAVKAYGPLALSYMASLRLRDQGILNKLAPAVNEAAAKTKRIVAKSEQGPITISMFYGGVHRSLFDALMHKAEMEEKDLKPKLLPAAGMDCLEGRYYSQFLRGHKPSREDDARLLVHGSIVAEGMALRYREAVEKNGWGIYQDRINELLGTAEYADLSKYQANRKDLASQIMQ